jgi:hypothetical protein
VAPIEMLIGPAHPSARRARGRSSPVETPMSAHDDRVGEDARDGGLHQPPYRKRSFHGPKSPN